MDDIFLELADVRLFWPKFSGVNGRKICEDGKKSRLVGIRAPGSTGIGPQIS